jgi:hypothetical protein
MIGIANVAARNPVFVQWSVRQLIRIWVTAGVRWMCGHFHAGLRRQTTTKP